MVYTVGRDGGFCCSCTVNGDVYRSIQRTCGIIEADLVFAGVHNTPDGVADFNAGVFVDLVGKSGAGSNREGVLVGCGSIYKGQCFFIVSTGAGRRCNFCIGGAVIAVSDVGIVVTTHHTANGFLDTNQFAATQVVGVIEYVVDAIIAGRCNLHIGSIQCRLHIGIIVSQCTQLLLSRVGACIRVTACHGAVKVTGDKARIILSKRVDLAAQFQHFVGTLSSANCGAVRANTATGRIVVGGQVGVENVDGLILFCVVQFCPLIPTVFGSGGARSGISPVARATAVLQSKAAGTVPDDESRSNVHLISLAGLIGQNNRAVVSQLTLQIGRPIDAVAIVIAGFLHT